MRPLRKRREPVPGAGSPVPAPGTARSFGAWRDIAPPTLVTQRSVAVTAADVGPSLASWRSPGVLRPLSHLVSASAPAGVLLEVGARSAMPAEAASVPRTPSVPRAPSVQRFFPWSGPATAATVVVAAPEAAAPAPEIA